MGDRARYRLEPLFDRRRSGIEAVAVAIEGVNRRRKTPDIVSTVPCDDLNLLGLPRQIGGGDTVLSLVDIGLIGQDSDSDGANRSHAPGGQPPRRSPVVSILIGEEADLHTLQIMGDHVVSQVFAAFCHQILSAPQCRRITP